MKLTFIGILSLCICIQAVPTEKSPFATANNYFDTDNADDAPVASSRTPPSPFARMSEGSSSLNHPVSAAFSKLLDGNALNTKDHSSPFNKPSSQKSSKLKSTFESASSQEPGMYKESYLRPSSLKSNLRPSSLKSESNKKLETETTTERIPYVGWRGA